MLRKTPAQPKVETAGLKPSHEAVSLPQPQFREVQPTEREREPTESEKGDPTPLCSRTRVKGGAGSCHCSTEAVLQAQYGMAACDGSPELITFPRGALRKHLLLFTACSARGMGARGISEGLQVVQRCLGTAQCKAEPRGWAGSTALSHLQSPTVKSKEQAVAQLGAREPWAALGLHRLLPERGTGYI